MLPRDGGDYDSVLAAVCRAGVDLDAMARDLQEEGAAGLAASWHAALDSLAAKAASLTEA